MHLKKAVIQIYICLQIYFKHYPIATHIALIQLSNAWHIYFMTLHTAYKVAFKQWQTGEQIYVPKQLHTVVQQVLMQLQIAYKH
jgi:hypothetical protein